jgi:ATPase subunit of ABC transporter with duplicated ATPase domains
VPQSSLFSLLTGRLHADNGDVEIPPRWRVGEVAQEMPRPKTGPPISCCRATRRSWLRRPTGRCRSHR